MKEKKKSDTVQHSPARRPTHFFKPLFPSYLQKLPIPTRFVRKFRDELSDVALLKGPSGSVWRVELKEIDGIVYFLKGWKEFVKNHSLCFGYFLVFRYDGNSQFSVLIFDTSACEKEYSYATENDEESCSNSGSFTHERESDDSVKILGVSKVKNKDLQTTKRKSRYKPQVLRSSLRLQSNAVKMKLNSETKSKDNNYSRRKDSSEELLVQSESRQSKSQKSVGSESLQQVESLDHPLLTQKRGGNKFIQSNGKGLMDSIRENVSNCSKKKTPIKATSMAFENQSTKSSVPSAGVKLSVKMENQQPEPDDLSSSLEVVKNIEDRKKDTMPLKRRGCNPFSERSNLTAAAKLKELVEAMKFKSDKPFFIAVMTSSNLRNGPRLHIPSAFAKEHFSVRPRKISLLSSDGREWVVACRYIFHGATYLSGGWSAFLSDNNLQGGEVCVFELVNRKDTSLKVTIFPADEGLHHKKLPQRLAVKNQKLTLKKRRYI